MSALVAKDPPPDAFLQLGPEPRFPLFRSHYCSATTWSAADRMNVETEALTSAASPTTQRPALRSLDLRSLPVEDAAPSETQLRRQKYLFFEKHCSEVSPGLFLSGDYVAKNRETLRQAGVTHVLNCVGFICKEYFKDELMYKTLYLQDTPAEDILCVLYDCLDYIDGALQSGGRILVHCSQGVSRSATLVIAYMMWRSGKPYDEVFAAVKAVRGVANPNIGFTCQLLQWQKRAASAKTRMRMYRIAPHCVHAPSYLVPKLITPPKQYPNNTHRDLDPRGAFVLQTPRGPTYVWRGEHCPDAYAEAAQRAAAHLRKFEGAGPVVEIRQGHEPAELLAMLDPAPLDAEAARINAKRSSITGEIELPSREQLAGVLTQQAASAPADMDVDAPSSSSALAEEHLAMDFTTPRPRSAVGESSAVLSSSGHAGHNQGPGMLDSVRWVPEEVDEYSDDYAMYCHGQQQGKAAVPGGGPYDSTMRISYDTVGAGMPSSGAQADCLFGGPSGRPDSPATKEGRQKKYRRADSERPKLGYWTAACSDGIGPELARTHNVSSLHESVDEDVLGLTPGRPTEGR
ncbi:hypothetical protein PLESTB_001393100 [Pleodorina starrii]|uniref:Uncharacterized protein n=1 Tax=Pleodorina starrii TaxID=330485 RepID=A0A9W6BVS1_9CHLO|nr:hypothetical protein PLESTM_000539400 [Pleodorina starrii]GLC58717.1 hypothetical protein PLESTB_001393100 [Pleodorina starrii]GLC75198.1 hypothetical protein PLESTF_001606000 [Pleodorina starrii]